MHAFSAGGVVIRHGQRRGRSWCWAGGGTTGGTTIWSLPKGTPDGDETPEQTALREVTEETGLRGAHPRHHR